MTLQYGNPEEPAATPISLCPMDPEMVAELIERKFGIRLAGNSVGRLLAQPGITPQKPLHCAIERDAALVDQWLNTAYPKIKKLAKAQGSDIYFGDAAHIRSDHHAGRACGNQGETPAVATTGARHAMSLVPAITAKRRMRFMVKPTGRMNAAVFIAFLRRLLAGVTRRICLIADRGPAHRAKQTKAFVDTLGGRQQLFFLPPYAPDRDPDGLVWKPLKADTVSGMVVTGKADFKSKVVSSMRSLQRNPRKIRACFQKPRLR